MRPTQRSSIFNSSGVIKSVVINEVWFAAVQPSGEHRLNFRFGFSDIPNANFINLAIEIASWNPVKTANE